MKLLKFYADWCGPCTRLTAWMEDIDLNVEVVNIDVDVNTDMKEEYEVTMLPTMVLLDAEGKKVEKAVGSDDIKMLLTGLA